MKNELTTEEIYLFDILKDPKLFSSLPDRLLDNKSFVLKAIEVIPVGQDYQFRKISETLRDDKEVIFKMVAKHPQNMTLCSIRLMKDKDVALACLKHKNGSLDYLHYDLVDELHKNGMRLVKDAIKYLEVAALKEKLQNELPSNEVKPRKSKI